MISRLLSWVPGTLAVCVIGAAAGYLLTHPAGQTVPTGRAPSTATPLAAQAPPNVSVPPGGGPGIAPPPSAALPTGPVPAVDAGTSGAAAGAAAQRPPSGEAVRKPAAAVPAVRAAFHVQAGAFRQRAYADDLVRRLRARGYSVTIVDGPLIRVWVGSPMRRAAAEELAEHLRAGGFDAVVTPAP